MGHRRWVLLLLVLGAVSVGAEPKALPLVWEYPTPRALPQAILVDRMGREALHVALKEGGLAILDTSKPTATPTLLATVGTDTLGKLPVMHLTQQKDLLYLALGDFFHARGARAGLAIVSVAKLREPKVLAVWQSDQDLNGAATILVRDRYAYLGAMKHGVFIFDVGEPAKPRKIGEFLPEVDFPHKNPNKVLHPNARGLALKENLLYVAYDAGGLRVVNVADPRKPREVGRYVNAGMRAKQQAYNNLVLDGPVAYVAIDYAGLEVLDVKDPAQIKQISWWNPWQAETLGNVWLNSAGHTNQIEYDAKRRLVYLSAGDSDLLVVDVREPTKPMLVARYGEPKDKQGVWGLTLGREHVYLAYIHAVVPFQGTWAGLKAIKR